MSTVVWFRRDLRLWDNRALSAALATGQKILPIFIWDPKIVGALKNPKHPRVHFMHQALQQMRLQLNEHSQELYTFYDEPLAVFQQLKNQNICTQLYFNEDYTPYAQKRDAQVLAFAKANTIAVHTFCDHLLLHPQTIVNKEQRPYRVFTPFKKQFLQTLVAEDISPCAVNLQKAHSEKLPWAHFHSLEELGFDNAPQSFPPLQLNQQLIANYAKNRDFPALEGTTKLGVHLRFGTLSVRHFYAAVTQNNLSEVLASELIWREFFAMILWHFPHIVRAPFQTAYTDFPWENDEKKFQAWCKGQTGYPLVDAAMHQLNETGWMHNRLRMLVASFLCKNLLIDWRWGERYFAEKLIDYELASNVCGWQWAAGVGADAAPYFRIFSPLEQAKKFDAKGIFVKRYAAKPLPPIIDWQESRKRALQVYKTTLANAKAVE